MRIPNEIDVKLESNVFNNFRCQVAANSLDIDVKKKSIHHLHIENINIHKNWNIGLIYGASGSGKTTLVKKMFGENIFENVLDDETPIINQLPESLTYEDCANLLNGIGLNSVNCWIRPVKTLSNGQRARAEAVLLMCKEQEIVFIDEWTSVVDRVVAKAMSVCINKFCKKFGKKIVLLSCHNDIIEWLKPDWMIDCNQQKFVLPKCEDFFFKEREKLIFEIREIDRSSWKYFSKYHYLSDKLPGGIIYLYGLFIDNKQIGFQCFANYTPFIKGKKNIFHSNRTVIHPDYNGLGIGIKLINETSRYLKEKINCRIMAKFSAVPVFKSMIKQNCWRFIKEELKFDKMKSGDGMERKSGFREKGIKTFHFEYVENKEKN